MRTRFILLAIVAIITGCSEPRPLAHEDPQQQLAPAEAPQITAEEQANIDAETARLEKIESARRANPELNWLRVGISTGKYSESISSRVYKTHDECERDQSMEDRTCSPIAALPQSYWEAGR